MIHQSKQDYKSQCGCQKGQELISRYDLIDVVEIYPIGQPEKSELIFRIEIGKTLSGYGIFDPIEYCPYCGNRFDGLVPEGKPGKYPPMDPNDLMA